MTRPAPDTLWRLLEAYHAVVYYAPERQAHYQALGLKGGWMGYFATRSAALGEVSPAVVTACFYNFKHALVARALPDAWRYTTPAKAGAARLAVFDEAISRMLDDQIASRGMREAAELAVNAVAGCEYAGRPLFAAHAALDVPDRPHLALFWASAALREFRGDGHIMALSAAGVDGCAANVLMVALGLVPDDQRSYRGWTDEDWDAAVDRLAQRGWLTADGRITPDGRRARSEIERTTDELAQAPLRHLGADAARRLVELLTPIASRIVTAGGVPYPNGMGMPSVPELSAAR